jgi:hypothetical protein
MEFLLIQSTLQVQIHKNALILYVNNLSNIILDYPAITSLNVQENVRKAKPQ